MGFKGVHGRLSNGGYCPVLYAWYNMRYRCLNDRHKDYPNYGGRGITVCQRWVNSFEDFLADMGDRPPGTSLDRIDNSGNYCPENCRWATKSQQQKNTRQNRRITAFGMTLTVSEWCRETGINRNTLNKRLKLGWDAERAVSP